MRDARERALDVCGFEDRSGLFEDQPGRLPQQLGEGNEKARSA
jgi:hypothetical protein